VIAVLASILIQATPAASPSAAPSPPAVQTPSPSAPPPGTLVASPATVGMNPAQQRVVTVSGSSGTISARLDSPLAAVSVDQVAHAISIAASNATGSTVLHVSDASGAAVDVPVRVAFNAGTIVPQATLKITGSPVDPQWLAREANALIARLDPAQPGAQVTVGAPSVAPAAPPQPGASADYLFPVQIGGLPDDFDVQGTTALHVTNVPATPFAPGTLFYDDDPERIAQDGVLFRGVVGPDAPARLYYYHDVPASDRRRLVVVLSTESSDPASVQLVGAQAGPNHYVMTVGNAVTRSFLTIKPRNQGTIVDLDAGVPYVVRDRVLSDRQGAAGTIDVRVLSGGSVRVTVLALSPGADPNAFLGAPVLPGDGHHRTGVFNLGDFGSHALAFNAGGPDAKLVIGDRDPTLGNADPAATGRDYGDYGVWYDLAFTLANPGDAPAQVYLYFRPIGGVARGSFTVDGIPLDLGCMRLSVPYEIAAYTLSARETRVAHLSTMTDGGSNYPVEIGATVTAPQPTAPPVSSPDGCFPKTVPPSPATAATPAPAQSPPPLVPSPPPALVTPVPGPPSPPPV